MQTGGQCWVSVSSLFWDMSLRKAFCIILIGQCFQCAQPELQIYLIRGYHMYRNITIGMSIIKKWLNLMKNCWSINMYCVWFFIAVIITINSYVKIYIYFGNVKYLAPIFPKLDWNSMYICQLIYRDLHSIRS